jgi:hypothetical protein|nr:MAG TPA: ChiA1-BD-binding domain protein [Caudoviricetes sp.]
MKAWIKTDEEGRLSISTTIEKYSAGMTEIEVDDDFDFSKQMDYVFKDGKLVYDGKATVEQMNLEAKSNFMQLQSYQMQAATLMYINSSVAASMLSDADAMKFSTLYDKYSDDNVEYKKGKLVRFNGNVYRCEKDHMSQLGWNPENDASEWSKVNIASDGIDIWIQPTGAHNAYNIGDKVHYPDADSDVYVSLIDGNVWSPEVYLAGWKKDSNEPKPDEYPEWVRPTGAHDAYSKGDKVSHNQKHWQSDADGNVWEPGVYGWTELH